MKPIAMVISAMLMIGFLQPALAEKIKESNSGICHDAQSRWYERTKNFTSYESMAACLRSGRAYKGYSGVAVAAPEKRQIQGSVPYDRDLYDHWIDQDRDCQNARHELLQDLSTGPVHLNASGCTVAHGRWNDPYTGLIFTNPREMDIDHMVPLAWAHVHGADRWDAAKRTQFANDPKNLFAVQAAANRAKGAKGPLDWLPPNTGYHCEYVTRFHRIVLTYRLTYSQAERQEMEALRARLCS